ncbi:hypothetical protein [Pseudothermotoga elfii]|uniref:hypothetical protein n=1 Tax=Pseudothermotoga elfii TaxID=38322 RepID=UPI00041ED09B|nr:hypothetical protein [Pseudothermotoga elfii]
MNKQDKPKDREHWAVGAMTLIGVGVGFIFLQRSVMWFVASILIGIGSGLLISVILSRKNS